MAMPMQSRSLPGVCTGPPHQVETVCEPATTPTPFLYLRSMAICMAASPTRWPNMPCASSTAIAARPSTAIGFTVGRHRSEAKPANIHLRLRQAVRPGDLRHRRLPVRMPSVWTPAMEDRRARTDPRKLRRPPRPALTGHHSSRRLSCSSSAVRPAPHRPRPDRRSARPCRSAHWHPSGHAPWPCPPAEMPRRC